jgi:hypothetical protein
MINRVLLTVTRYTGGRTLKKLDHVLQLVSVEKESVQLCLFSCSYILNNPKTIFRRDIRKAVSHWLRTAADQVLSEVKSSGICGG